MSLVLFMTATIPQVDADMPLLYDYEGYNAAKYDQAPSQTFRSSSIVAPRLQVNTWNRELVDKSPYIFLGLWSPLGGNAGPYLYSTDDLSLVYAEQRWPSAHNTQIQRYKDEDFLVFYQGEQRDGHSSGTCIFYDSKYEVRHSVEAVGFPGASVDMHECQVTEEGTVLISIYETRDLDTSSAGGLTLEQGGKLLDSLFQEVDLETGELVFQWRASDWYSLQDSYFAWDFDKPEGWDFFHLNSVEKSAEGHYLVSARHTHTITYVNGTSGEPIWTLGGKRNGFKDLSNGEATNFAWNHHARFRGDAGKNGAPPQHLTLFDNHNLDTAIDAPGCNNDNSTTCSRGKHLQLDYDNMTARLVKDYFHPANLVSGAMGGYTFVPNGNVLIGWGLNPTFTEHTPDGECVLDVQYNIWKPEGEGRGHYRTFKSDWVGRPTWPPSLAWEDVGGGLTVPGSPASRVYLSWNGATEVASWQIIAGNSTSMLDVPSKLFPRAGFETTITIGAGVRYGQAVALDKQGIVLGRTDVIDLQNGDIIPEPQVQL